MIVSDLAIDPLWADFRDLALSRDLRACWSTPILDSHQQVVGTFVPNGSLIEVVASTVHPDDRERLETFFRHATATPGSHEIEYRLIVSDGSIRIIEVEGQLIGDAGGRPARFVGTVHDITERRAGEDSLKELAFRLEEAQRLAHIGSWEWVIAPDVLWWSDEIYQIFGIGKSEFGANVEAFWACVHPDDVASVKASEGRAFNGLGHDVEHRIVLPDGSIRWVHELGEVDFGHDGKPVRMRGNQRFLDLWRIPAALAAERDDAKLLAFVWSSSRTRMVSARWCNSSTTTRSGNATTRLPSTTGACSSAIRARNG